MIENSTPIIINSAKACAVTGHRRGYEDLDKNKLKEVFISLINDGYDTFLVGMAIGFDTLCFKLLYHLKSEYDIKIVACIPCLDQNKNFSASQNKEYLDMLNKADFKVLVSKNYHSRCMMQRNIYMVDNSSILVACLRQDSGGTFNTVQYEKKVNKKIIYI